MTVHRVFSFGGGRQSTAALVLAARGELQADCFVFANVGNDSENPDTLAYVEQYAKPFAQTHGIELVEVQRQFRDKRGDTLYQYVQKAPRSVDIPVRMQPSGAPGNRNCTADWKIAVIAKYLKTKRGWPSPYEMLLGISWDESHRMRDPEVPDKDYGYHRRYPLCERRLTVADCGRIVAEAGLPPAPKSACWFCPFHDTATWAKQRLHRPDLFDKAVALERLLNEKRAVLGKDEVFLSNRCRPLDVAVPEGTQQLTLPEDEDAACTSGYCWT